MTQSPLVPSPDSNRQHNHIIATALVWVRDNPARSFFWASLWLGILLRLFVFAGGRMLWLDESMIALNLVTRTPDELLQPLNFLQLAPIGWLFANKALFELTGSVDYGLRIVSLLSGLGALGLFAWLVRRLFTLPIAACMTLVFSVSSFLIRYSSELKPYSVDVFFTLAVLCLALLVIDGKGRRTRLYIALLALTGLVGITFSLPLVYVLGGCGGIAFFHLCLDGHRLNAALLSGTALVWLLVFVYLMRTFYLGQADSAGFNEAGVSHFFDRAGFAPIPPTSFSDLVWYPRWAHNSAKSLFGEFAAYPALLLTGAGVWLMGLKRPWLLAMILATLGLAFAGSALKAYPLFERLILFSLPLLLLLVAHALEALRDELSNRARLPVLTAMVVALIIGSLFPLADGMRSKPAFAKQDLTQIMGIIKSEFQPGDRLVLSTGAVPSFLLYRDRYGLADTEWTIIPEIEDFDACFANSLSDMLQGSRLWSIQILPLSTPSNPASVQDFSGVFDGAALIVTPKVTDAQVRLDLFTPDWTSLRGVKSSPADCDFLYDISRELRGGLPPQIYTNP